MSTEVAEKTQTVKELKGQIERLESEKGKIQDWVKAQEARVDAVNAKVAAKQAELAKAQAEHDAKRKKAEDATLALGVQSDEISRKRGEIQYAQSRLDESAANFKNSNQEYQKRISDLEQREAVIVKKEQFLKTVFDNLETLKNAK